MMVYVKKRRIFSSLIKYILDNNYKIYVSDYEIIKI